jgi:hypothetical protein
MNKIFFDHARTGFTDLHNSRLTGKNVYLSNTPDLVEYHLQAPPKPKSAPSATIKQGVAGASAPKPPAAGDIDDDEEKESRKARRPRGSLQSRKDAQITDANVLDRLLIANRQVFVRHGLREVQDRVVSLSALPPLGEDGQRVAFKEGMPKTHLKLYRPDDYRPGGALHRSFSLPLDEHERDRLQSAINSMRDHLTSPATLAESPNAFVPTVDMIDTIYCMTTDSTALRSVVADLSINDLADQVLVACVRQRVFSQQEQQKSNIMLLYKDVQSAFETICAGERPEPAQEAESPDSEGSAPTPKRKLFWSMGDVSNIDTDLLDDEDEDEAARIAIFATQRQTSLSKIVQGAKLLLSAMQHTANAPDGERMEYQVTQARYNNLLKTLTVSDSG